MALKNLLLNTIESVYYSQAQAEDSDCQQYFIYAGVILPVFTAKEGAKSD